MSKKAKRTAARRLRHQAQPHSEQFVLLRWGSQHYTLVWGDGQQIDDLDTAQLAHFWRHEVELRGKEVELLLVDATWYGYRAGRVEPTLAALIAQDVREALRYINTQNREETATLIGQNEIGYFNPTEQALQFKWVDEITGLLKEAGAERITLQRDTLARTLARAYYVAAHEPTTSGGQSTENKYENNYADDYTTENSTLATAIFAIGPLGLTAIMCDQQGVVNEYAEPAPTDISTTLWYKAALEEAREGLSPTIVERFLGQETVVRRVVYLWEMGGDHLDSSLEPGLEGVQFYGPDEMRRAAAQGAWAIFANQTSVIAPAAFDASVAQQLEKIERALAEQTAAAQRARRKQLALSFARPLWIGACVAIILLTDAQFRLRATEKELQAWRTRKTQLAAQIEQMRRAVTQLEETAAVVKEIAGLATRAQQTPSQIEDLSARLSSVDGLTLQRLAISPQGEISITGRAKSTAEVAQSARAIEWDGRYRTPTVWSKEVDNEIEFEARTVRKNPLN